MVVGRRAGPGRHRVRPLGLPRGGGDPHLHTHVVISSSKVQTILDGKWFSLDGRPMHAATVALSELYEAVFADHLTRAFAVVPVELVVESSSQSRHIDAEKNRLIAEYAARHGRQPSTATIIKRRAEAASFVSPHPSSHRAR